MDIEKTMGEDIPELYLLHPHFLPIEDYRESLVEIPGPLSILILCHVTGTSPVNRHQSSSPLRSDGIPPALIIWPF